MFLCKMKAIKTFKIILKLYIIYKIIFLYVVASVDLTNEPTINVTNTGVNIENHVQKEDDSTFSLITWNIDGLDIHSLQDRAKSVCEYLALYTPDVVFLQEVIPPYYNYLKKRATSYTIISGNEDGYFTVVMLKKSRVKLISYEITPFPTTQMMRNLLCVHVSELVKKLPSFL
uniref:Tyrosyl-DNA phosphodiesterase 2 n=1 Tax=Vombatus ursinus TaxID=29139 RepID=A0A4X2M792_VOMUR